MYSMAWCRNHKVTGCQNQLTMYIFSIPVSLASSSCQELGGLVPKPQDEPETKPAYNPQFSLFLCHWLRTYVMRSKGLVSKPQGELCSLFPCHWLGAHVTCSGGLMSKAQVVPGKNQLTMQNFPPSPSLVIGSELMSCALGAWWKPQGEPGTKPAHNLHLQHFCVTGWELMP